MSVARRDFGHPTAFLLSIAALGIYFAVLLWGGKVFHPHRNEVEMGVVALGPGRHLFADVAKEYVPAMHRHANGRRSAWLSVWDPYPQLGMPLMQMKAVGRAYWLHYLLSFFSRNAYVLYTASVVAGVLLLAGFMFLLLRGERLHPLACTVGSLGVALWAFHHGGWKQNLVLHTATWSAGLLWLLGRWIRRASSLALLGIALSASCLVLSGYPQMVVWYGYLAAAWALWLAASEPGGARSKLAKLACAGLAFAAGVLLVWPALADTAHRTAQSARANVPVSFFLEAAGWSDAEETLHSFARLLPFLTALFLLSFGVRGRGLWVWRTFFIVFLLITWHKPIYEYAVRFLGFGISRSAPTRNVLWIPFFFLAAHGLHMLLRERFSKRFVNAVLVVLLAYTALTLTFLLSRSEAIVAAVLCLGTGLYLHLRRPWMLVALAGLTFGSFAARQTVAQPLDAIRLSSPLTEFLEDHLEGGERYAFLGPKGILPPNFESLLEIPSIHAYDSLSPRTYHRWIDSVSAQGAQLYGRVFNQIVGIRKLGADALGYAGIGLFISRGQIRHPSLAEVGAVNGYRFYRPRVAPRLEAQTGFYRLDAGRSQATMPGPLSGHAALGVERLEELDDYLKVRSEPRATETLLFLSHQYHPDWIAESSGRRLETLPVNGFFQGVLLPPDTSEIELWFRPLSLWLWVHLAVYAAGFVILGGVAVRTARSRKRTHHPSRQ